VPQATIQALVEEHRAGVVVAGRSVAPRSVVAVLRRAAVPQQPVAPPLPSEAAVPHPGGPQHPLLEQHLLVAQRQNVADLRGEARGQNAVDPLVVGVDLVAAEDLPLVGGVACELFFCFLRNLFLLCLSEKNRNPKKKSFLCCLPFNGSSVRLFADQLMVARFHILLLVLDRAIIRFPALRARK
jgi:hypothetical protein